MKEKVSYIDDKSISEDDLLHS